jgi:hypothetical protein
LLNEFARAHLQPTRERVDWFRIIVDLERHGYRHADMSAAIDVAKSTLVGWKAGSRPAYDEGERLVLLWCMVMRNGRDSVPKVDRYSHRA